MGDAMSGRAIVVIPTTATAADLLQPIAGVPALLRLLLCAQRAGLGEILLLGVNGQALELQAYLGQDSRFTARLICVDDQPWSVLVQTYPALEKAWWEDDLWVLPGTGVIDARLLRTAVERVRSRPISVLDSEPAPCSMAAVPFFRVSGARWQPVVQASGDAMLSAVLSAALQSRDGERLANHGLVCVPVVDATNRAAVERGLFKGLESASDGWVDRHLNRKLSHWFSRQFVRLPLTPNHVTFIACAIGLLAAVCLAHGSWGSSVLGAILLQWSTVIDCCDGEVARLKFLESTSGYYLDITCDNVVHIAVFVAIAWSGYQLMGQSYVLLLGGMAAFGTLMSFIMMLATHHGRPRQAPVVLDRLIDSLANRDFSLLVVICALTGTLHWFLWALAIGVNLFWLMVLGIAWQTQWTSHG
jgi:phosphatidylglycerophosphate synthase